MIIVGGPGDDTYILEPHNQVWAIDESSGGGIDTIITYESTDLENDTARGFIIGEIENVTLMPGYWSTDLYGSALSNTLTGNE